MKVYTVNIGGIEHTVQLTDEDAKAQGLTPVKPVVVKESPTPANKSRKASDNKGI